VFNGPWTYDEEPKGQASGVDKEVLDEGTGRTGAIMDLEQAEARQSDWATHLRYRVKK
jgi:hypothetical protein